jgi:hypothetical protein
MGVLPTGAFDGTTNNRADYLPHAGVGPTRMIRPSPALDKDATPFAGQSTYQANFVPQEVPYERVRPKNGYEPNAAPFDATTTHRTAFALKEVPTVVRAVTRKSNITASDQPFAGISTMKSDFTKMPAAKRAQMKPQHSTHVEAAGFDGEHAVYSMFRRNHG